MTAPDRSPDAMLRDLVERLRGDWSMLLELVGALDRTLAQVESGELIATKETAAYLTGVRDVLRAVTLPEVQQEV